MASLYNVPREILDSMRDGLDRRIKLSIKRMVNCETRRDKWEQRVVALSTYRMFVFTARVPAKVESNFHYLDIKSIESKKPNQLVITTANKTFSFTTLEADTDEVNHMITHIGTSLKTIFPDFPLGRLIKKMEVQPSDRLRVMNDMMAQIEQKEKGPCGGFTLMYACMCDYHGLTYRDEVAWDVDTIYLSQDSRELCLRDFDHLKERDLVPIVSALIHNTWFTTLKANNVKLAPEVCAEILHVMKNNTVIESLLLSNTGITTDFIKKLSTVSMSDTQLHKLDLSCNLIDDVGAEHIFGCLSSRGKMFTYIDLSRTKITSRGLNKVAEAMTKSPHVFSSVHTLKLANISSPKAEDLQNMYSFLASPNMISHLDLTGTDLELDKLMTPLQRGCSQNITFLKLSKTNFTSKRTKEVLVPASFKQFFASVYALKHLDLSGSKLPPEALKDMLLGIGSNRNLKDVHVDISGMDIQNQGAQHLQNCMTSVKNISSLNISNIVFQDHQDLSNVLNSIGQNKAIKHLSMGRVFQNIKLKNLKSILEELVHVIQDEDSAIESLSLADSKLKDSMNMIINALGSNASLVEIDISGNLMGDLGARMLSKALQINNKLKTIIWDKNSTGCQGFEDIADALEKNYTVKKMPLPVYDASVALRNHPERTEQALQTIERLLQRNHSPQKYSSDQAYRLQQGFLISSTQQMVDRLVVQCQDTVNALSMGSLEPYSADVDKAKSIIKDADNSKLLLPKLHDIAIESQNTGNPVEKKLKEIAADLKSVLETQMQKTVQDMLDSATKKCQAIMGDKSFMSDVRTGCVEKSAFPKDFTSNILDGVDTDIFNQLSELNLAVAAHVSDRVIDEVIERLSKTHKSLTNHLNQKRKDDARKSQTKSQKMEDDEANRRTKSTESPQGAQHKESPKVTNKRKSMHARKIRPQSVIDRDHVQVALDGDKKRPLTIPQTNKSPRAGSRSPAHISRSPKGQRSPKEQNSNTDTSNLSKPPRSREKLDSPSLKPSRASKNQSRSPSNEGSRSNSPLPKIEITSSDFGDLSGGPIYDNVLSDQACAYEVQIKYPEIQDGLDADPEPIVKTPEEKTPPPKNNAELIESFDDVPELTQGTKLNHATKQRPRRPKNIRPTTRQSAMPTSSDVKVDEDVESFFTMSAGTTATVAAPASSTKTKEEKSSSAKTTPESKKKSGGIFGFGNKEHKENKDKDQKKPGKLGGIFRKASPKPSPPPVSAKKGSRISDVQEEVEDHNNSAASLKNITESPSRSSLDTKSDKSDKSSTKSDNGSQISDSEKTTAKEDIVSEKSTESNESDSENGLVKSTEIEKVEEKTAEKEKKPEEKTAEKEKKPIQLPKTKKSTEKRDEKTAAVNQDDKSEHSSGTVEKVDSEVKEKQEEEKVNEDDDDVKKESEKQNEEDNKDESKVESTEEKSEEAEKEEEPAKSESPKPAGSGRRPGGPGGVGFGVNIMAEMLAKQQKRKSEVPGAGKSPIQKPTEQDQSAEEKQSPLLGLKKLKPVGSKVTSSNNNSKDSTSDKTDSPTVVLSKPADNIASELANSSTQQKKAMFGEKVTSVKRTSSGKESPSPVAAVAQKQSTKEEEPVTGAKPSVAPRIAGLNKPPPPTRPKPPIASSKPTPAPRKSMSSSESGDPAEDQTKADKKNTSQSHEDKTVESGIVYDSATLKMSVKDKISKFKNPSADSGGIKKEKPLSASDKEEQPLSKDSVAKQTEKDNSLSRNMKTSDIEKFASLPKLPDVSANDRDLKMEENTDMTDSGIMTDSTDKISVKDKASLFGNGDIGGKKAGSLPRNVKATDVDKDTDGASKRPKSMFAVLESRPDLKKQKESDTKVGIPEEKESNDKKEENKKEAEEEPVTDADDVIMV